MTRDDVPGCCQNCKHYKSSACELLADPTDDNRRIILKAPCRPRDFALRWLGWASDAEGLVHDVLVAWLEASPEQVLAVLGDRPRDARRWRWIIERWLGRTPRRRAARRASQEAPVEEMPNLAGVGEHEAWEVDERCATAVAGLAEVSAIDVAILVVVLTPGSPGLWEAAGPGSQATRTRRIARAIWRFQVIYQDVSARWWPASEAALAALEERWFRPGIEDHKAAFERTVERLPGVVETFTAWREELYLPGAKRSLELLRESLSPAQMATYERTWRDLLGLPVDTKTRSNPPGSAPPSAPPTPPASPETNVDSKTMTGVLCGDLDAAKIADVLRALTRPEAHTDRMALAEMARAIDAARALHEADPFTELDEATVEGLEEAAFQRFEGGGRPEDAGGSSLANLFARLRARIDQLTANFSVGTMVLDLGMTRGVTRGAAQRVSARVGDALSLSCRNLRNHPVWILMWVREHQGSEADRTYHLNGTVEDAKFLPPGGVWQLPPWAAEPGAADIVVVATRFDPRLRSLQTENYEEELLQLIPVALLEFTIVVV